MSTTPEETPEIKMQREQIDKALQNLREYFETVQILCTSLLPDDGKTRFWQRGSGNWFARVGQIKDWIIRQDEESRCEVRREQQE